METNLTGAEIMTNLKTVRESKGLSQSQLARASGVSVRQIQHYEQGFRDINKASVETVWKLAEALHCEMTDIMEM